MMRGRLIRLRHNIRKRWPLRGVRTKHGKRRERVLRRSAEASRRKDRREMGPCGASKYLQYLQECDASPRTPELNLNLRGRVMREKWNDWVGVGALAAFLMCGAATAGAQSGPQGGQSKPAQQQQQPPAQADKDKQPNPAPLSMDNAAASPEEESAYKMIQLAEEFLQKYAQSRYRPTMYQSLVSGYFATQQVPKMLDAGEKEIEMNPNDAPVLAVMAQTLARTYNAKAPDAAKQLDKAEL